MYVSGAINLVANDTNSEDDVFLWERATKLSTRVSVSTYGEQTWVLFASRGAAITRDGRFLAFSTDAPNLVSFDHNGAQDVFVKGSME